MDLPVLNGKRFAILLMGTDAHGEDAWSVFSGVARVDGATLVIERGLGNPDFEVRFEWLDRIKQVGSDNRSILMDAEYYIPLTVGNLPDGFASDSLFSTGLRWPD